MSSANFANRTSLALWVFVAAWLAMLMAFTALVVRDGPPPGTSLLLTTVFLAVFWLGGVAAVGVATGKACFHVAITPARVTFTSQYPFKRRRISVPAELAGRPVVVESRDTDGDRYFHARLDLPDGEVFDLAEGHSREYCEARCRDFSLAIERAVAMGRGS